ncbi:hypothetical protein HMI56_002108 [Coelomomyces lativittatus]|nr:hypothetical protein HMI56_002108 [Coelomomyces lativittatus]
MKLADTHPSCPENSNDGCQAITVGGASINVCYDGPSQYTQAPLTETKAIGNPTSTPISIQVANNSTDKPSNKTSNAFTYKSYMAYGVVGVTTVGTFMVL